ncbi:MAG: hypothetical protein NT157_00070, partial [Candidatus Micrarchaeota archaeon]|nr:hypothetical protein [Candidatus Micrarchaeota archaeon]
AEKQAYDYPLDLYVPEKLSELGKSVSGFRLLSDENGTLRSFKTRRITYDFTLGGMALRASKVFLIRNATAYAFTYVSTPVDFEDYLPIFNAALQTFDLAMPPSKCVAGTCDQGACIVEELSACCGNGRCENGEACASCAADCGVCIVKPQLDASVYFLEGEAREFKTINCFDFRVRVRIINPHDAVLTVNSTSQDVVELRTDAGANCVVKPLEVLDCYALVSGAFGERGQENSKAFEIGLMGYAGTETKNTTYYYTTLGFDATNTIIYAGSDCSHFWCIPGNNVTFGNTNFTVTGIVMYSGYQLCHGQRLLANGASEHYYFNQFLPEYCREDWNEYGYPVASSKRCNCDPVKGTC